MNRKQLLARLRAQVALVAQQEDIRVSDVLCSKEEMMNIMETDNLFRAAERFSADTEITKIRNGHLVLPDDDGFHVYKNLSKALKK